MINILDPQKLPHDALCSSIQSNGKNCARKDYPLWAMMARHRSPFFQASQSTFERRFDSRFRMSSLGKQTKRRQTNVPQIHSSLVFFFANGFDSNGSINCQISSKPSGDASRDDNTSMASDFANRCPKTFSRSVTQPLLAEMKPLPTYFRFSQAKGANSFANRSEQIHFCNWEIRQLTENAEVPCWQ